MYIYIHIVQYFPNDRLVLGGGTQSLGGVEGLGVALNPFNGSLGICRVLAFRAQALRVKIHTGFGVFVFVPFSSI